MKWLDVKILLWAKWNMFFVDEDCGSNFVNWWEAEEVTQQFSPKIGQLKKSLIIYLVKILENFFYWKMCLLKFKFWRREIFYTCYCIKYVIACYFRLRTNTLEEIKNTYANKNNCFKRIKLCIMYIVMNYVSYMFLLIEIKFVNAQKSKTLFGKIKQLIWIRKLWLLYKILYF